MQTQTTPTANLTFAPVTPAVARLLHKLQAELLKWEPTAAAIAPGAIVLPDRLKGIWRFDGDTISCRDHKGNEDRLHRRRLCPESWASSGVPWHPSHWRLNQSRRDTNGRDWDSSGGAMVTDDFGDLVEVAA